jgi:hypothetical protein
MSKHLRFGRLLALLAILLTVSFAWVQASNLSSEKASVSTTPAAMPVVAVQSATLEVPYCGGGGVYSVDGVLNSSDFGFTVNAGADITDLNYTLMLAADTCSVTADKGTVDSAPVGGVVNGNADFSGGPVTITVTDGSGTSSYTLTVTKSAANTDNELTAFWFDHSLNTIGNADAVGDIDPATRIVTVHVPFGTDPDGLIASFTLDGFVMTHSEDVSVPQTSGVTPNDYTDQVAFTVWSESCTSVEYFVDVVVDENGGNNILSLSLTSLEYPNCKSCEDPADVDVMAEVDTVAGTVRISVPYGTDLANIEMVAELTDGATIAPALATSYTAGVPQTYTVTAANGISTHVFTLTIEVEAALSGNQLLTFGFETENNPGLLETRWNETPIDYNNYRIDVMVPYGTDLTNLVASYTHSPMSCVYLNGPGVTDKTLQCSGEYTSNDFSDAVTYTVIAQNGDEAYYNIYVSEDAPLTDKELNGFMVTGLTYCQNINMDPDTYDVPGDGTTDIAVSVKYGTSVTDLMYAFTVSEESHVVASNGTLNQVGTDVTGSADFTEPVTFTVTAQDGSEQEYVVTVTVRDENSDKMLTKYWLAAADNGATIGPNDAMGTINEAEKKVDVWVPWGTAVNSLVARFELNNNTNNFPGGAVMTHSEDLQVVQTSGVSANDFTTPVAYTVVAEDCSTVEYFVTVHITPNSDTGISAFAFSYEDCGCNLKSIIDAYARRIYITVPSTVDISHLAPSTITVTPPIGNKPGATVSPAVGVAQDWTKGPIKYTVTAPDGVTKADWMVSVANPACKNTNILAFSLPYAQVSSSDLVAGHGVPVAIDTTNHKIDVIIKKGVTLSSIYYERTLPCGASICCVGGNCQDNHYLDFSQGGCHTCVVTAQDPSVTQEWTICVHEIDTQAPEVTTWSVMAYNCTDSVAVQTNELGRVFIVNESAINMNDDPTKCTPIYNLADWDDHGANSVADLVNARLGAWATADTVDAPIYINTNGLYSGTYWAFAVDNAGRVSCISKEKLFLDMCDVTVATMCDLRDQPDVWRYTLSEEVFVSYEETRVGGNWKFVQDASCGILIEDRLNALPVSYGQGAGLTNIKGMLDKSGIALKFIPVCCYSPDKSSTGNVITPIDVPFASFAGDIQNGLKYESMLVRLSTPVVAANDYGQGLKWVYDGLDLLTTSAQSHDWFIQSALNSPLIGTTISTVPSYYTGVRTNITGGAWGSGVYGLITPRKAADIVPAPDVVMTANPNPATISGVLVGSCGSTQIKIYNEGIGTANITALYLDDAAATDGFNLIDPTAVPFNIGSWGYNTVTVNFCPTAAGDKMTYLNVEYGTGKILRIPINGSTMLIYGLPFHEDFNASTPPAAWKSFNMIFGNIGYNLITDGNGYYYGWSWITPNSANPIYLITPGIDLSGADHPTLTFHYGTYYSSNFRVDVSEDYTNWTTVKNWGNHTLGNGVGTTYTVDLTAYAGKTVFIRFYSTSANYFGIDEVKVQEKVTTPVIASNPKVGDFGGVQVGETGTLNFSITNAGVSILKIKKVEIVGDEFSLTDTNTYPFEVTDGPGTWAYTVGSAGTELDFTANFSPTDIGVFTGKIVITYGLYDDQTFEIPLTGEGLSCYTAAEATIGRNWAPSQNTWFKYTADKFSIVEVTSCDVNQDAGYDAEYAWDTYLYVYGDCEGTLLAENDDMEGDCVYNRASSRVELTMNEGETIYIFWPLEFPGAAHAYEGFYFNINVSYPIDGDVCENAIPLTLPVVNMFGTTRGFNDDYDASPCSPFSNYMDGNDVVYTITIAEDGYLNGTILGAYGSIHVLDVCPKEELTKDHCKAYTGGPNGGTFRKPIAAGTYFVIISTWAPPQTVDFLLNMSWEHGSGVDNNDLSSTLNVYPNPNTGKFTVNISNQEASDMTIELVNMSGQVVYRNQVTAAYSYNEDIDASSFAKGIYYLKVNNGKGVKVEKVVVE